MTPTEIESWRADIKAFDDAVMAEYIAEIRAEVDRINAEIDQCWAERWT